MTKPRYVISESQLAKIIGRDILMLREVRSQPLSSALKAERERVLDAVIQIINNNCYTLEGARLKNTPLVIIRNIESLRSEP